MTSLTDPYPRNGLSQLLDFTDPDVQFVIQQFSRYKATGGHLFLQCPKCRISIPQVQPPCCSWLRSLIRAYQVWQAQNAPEPAKNIARERGKAYAGVKDLVGEL